MSDNDNGDKVPDNSALVARDFHQYRAGREVIERLGHFLSAACVGTGSSVMIGILRGVIFNVHFLSAFGSMHARTIRQ